MVDPSIIAVITIGLLHGLEPGHGWPVAFLYSTKRQRPLFYGLITSSLISFFHFISSITVVLVYVLISTFVAFPVMLMKYVAGGILIILAYRFFMEKVEDEYESQHGHFHDNDEGMEHEHEHEHPDIGRHSHLHKHAKKVALTLWGIAVFAFVLGFAHEEEFALLALTLGGVNPLILMVSYAVPVTIVLIGITLICIKTYARVQSKIKRYKKYIPKINGLILLIMAAAFIFGFA